MPPRSAQARATRPRRKPWSRGWPAPRPPPSSRPRAWSRRPSAARARQSSRRTKMASPKTILTHANVIDCVDPTVQPDRAVVIEDGRIRAIVPSAQIGEAGDALVIDLNGAYPMAQLWDVHIHPYYLSLPEMPLAHQVTLFGHRLPARLPQSRLA